MLLPSNGALVFESDHRPLALWDQGPREPVHIQAEIMQPDRKSTRLNSSHLVISYAVFCLKKNQDLDTGGNPYAARVFDTGVLEACKQLSMYALSKPQFFFFYSTGAHKFPLFSPTRPFPN